MDKKSKRLKKQLIINTVIIFIVGLILTGATLLYGSHITNEKFLNSAKNCTTEEQTEAEYFECVNEIAIERTQRIMISYISTDLAMTIAALTILSSVIYYRHSKLSLNI